MRSATKKLILSTLAIVIFSNLSFAKGKFHYDLHELPLVNVVNMGYGGYHAADITSFYSIIQNPANTALTGKKMIFPSLCLNTAGNIDLIPDLMMNLLNKSDSIDPMTKVLNSLASAETINLNLAIDGPLNFGMVNNHFGFAFFNKSYLKAEAPSINTANIYLGESAQMLLSYGYPVPLGPVTFAVGLNAIGYTIMEANYLGSTTQLLNFNFENLPLYRALGFTLNLGATLDFWKVFRLSFTWNDLFSQFYVTKFSSFKEMFSWKFFTSKENATTEAGYCLKAGLAIDLPTKKWTKGFVSSWVLYLDCNDILCFTDTSILAKNPILSFSAGTEVKLFNTFAFRVGLNQSYLSAGVGLQVDKLHIDYAIYGAELGLEPGTVPTLNMALALTIQY